MNGRPLLHLINRLVLWRHSVGAATLFHWVRAHSDEVSVQHVGNRVADNFAKQQCRPQPRGEEKKVGSHVLPLELEEPFVCLRDGADDVDGGGRVITTDPRSECRRRLRLEALDQWRSSKSQSLFSVAAAGVAELWNFARINEPSCCGFVLRSMCNVLQWYRTGDGGTSVAERVCSDCDAPGLPPKVRDTCHLVECDVHSLIHHHQTMKLLLALLHSNPVRFGGVGRLVDAWLALPEQQLVPPTLLSVLKLFRMVDGSIGNIRVASVVAVFGGFSESKANSSWLTCGVEKIYWKKLTIEVRRLLLTRAKLLDINAVDE